LDLGFLESVYKEALDIEFTLRGIPCERQKPINLVFKNKVVGDSRLDFLVAGEWIVELKAVEVVHPIHPVKVVNYLRIMNLQLALLINFNVLQLKNGIKRIVWSDNA
jgi:GxxExxY protein